MKLSIVATLYRSAQHIAEFHQRVSDAARDVAGDDYEVVLVNDGSPDDSLARAIALTEVDARVVVVDLSRNFGHHKAMMTGLAHTRGELIFLIDSDLEERPDWLLPFSTQLRRDGCDVVYGVQRERKGGIVERWTGSLFYRLMRAMSDVDMPLDMVTARLMTRRYVAALLRHEEREIDIGGLWAITGFDQRPQLVDKSSTSETTYTLRRRFALLVNSVTSFSSAPLVLIFYVGVAISLASFIYLLFVLAMWVATSRPVSGWTSLIVSVWLLGGTIIAFIGVIGLYLSKMFTEVKQRPYTIVKDVHGRN
ncbi:glycosyltransferase family 2 protein [uncultured Sphingomonas sp.]|uniref:glycosyltransferase family 2 protein n=1 Tax=uncultured Sphingomonas sp. TaxID=158754 RepID=UPI0035C9D6F0